MVRKQEIIDMFEEIKYIDTDSDSDTIEGFAVALGKATMKNDVLKIIRRRFASRSD